MQKFQFCLPVNYHFGSGVVDEMMKESLPGKRALLVTGGKTIETNGTLSRVKEILEKRCEFVVVVNNVPSNPTRSFVMKAAEICRDEHMDFVVGLGGGSSMDSAKAVAAMAVNDGDLWNYVTVGTGGKKSFAVKPLPVILITTTAGTGSEGNRVAVITNEVTGEKVGIRIAYPQMSYADPELTLSIPPQTTAIQGFDALCHNMEAYFSIPATPFSDALIVDAVRRIFEFLPCAVLNGSDIEARENMTYAASVGGMVISISSCSGAHTIEHMLSGINPKIAHGQGLAMISQAFHAKIAEHAPLRYAEMADALKLTDPAMNEKEKAKQFLCALGQLMTDCGLTGLTLKDFNFSSKDYPRMIELVHTIAGGRLSRDRYSLSDEDIVEIFDQSL